MNRNRIIQENISWEASRALIYFNLGDKFKGINKRNSKPRMALRVSKNFPKMTEAIMLLHSFSPPHQLMLLFTYLHSVLFIVLCFFGYLSLSYSD